MMHNLAAWMRRVFQAWLRLILHEQARWEGEAAAPKIAPVPKPKPESPVPRNDEPSLSELVAARNEERKHRPQARDEGN